MKRIAWGGLAVALVLAACSSKDAVLNSGTGGNAHGGSGGTGHGGAAGTASGGSGGTASGGTGGARACDVIECLRPYECVRSCGGPIESSGCCACTPPLFDNFMNMACGGNGGAGTGGSAGATGAGGRGGTSGNAGATGTAGRGGNGGSAGATGAAGRGGTTGSAGTTGAAGRGGTSGSAGAGGNAGTTGSGGTGGRLCETAQCVRPYVCKRYCGGPIVTNNCCACDPPLFDDFNDMVCGDGGSTDGPRLMDCTGLTCGSSGQLVNVRVPALGITQCACVPVSGGQCTDCTCGESICTQFTAHCLNYSATTGLTCTENG